jgi:hypothetical protein
LPRVNMPSEKTLSLLAEIDSLKALSQSLAMLDAILSPEWQYRYYSFNSKWDKGEMMASMRNGSGDEYFIWFTNAGAIIKGFAHESSMSPYANESGKVWKGVLDDVPNEFRSILNEPAFSIKDTTFCIWRKYHDSEWQVGDIAYAEDEEADGSEYLLSVLNGDPELYKEFAEEYYEQEIEISAIEHIYKHKPLTEGLIASINRDIALEDLQEDIEEIGYPA